MPRSVERSDPARCVSAPDREGNRGVRLTAHAIDAESAPAPTLQDVFAARKHVYEHLKPTPLYHYASLSQLVGTDIWVKHENHNPTGAFKVRGGLNLVATLDTDTRAAGLYTASTGNHGQSIAYAARANDVRAVIAAPEGANPSKVASMRALGAEVVLIGKDFDEARQWAMDEAEKNGGHFVGPTDEPLICGVATYALEIMEALPEVDTVIVPVGAGSGACGVSIVAKTINPKIEVIAVQSAQAPTQQWSWKAGHPVTGPMETFAEGVATRVPFDNTQRILRKYLDDFLLIDDDATKEAIRLYIEHTRNLVEGAGAIPLAAALQHRERLTGKKVVLIASGGNLSMTQLQQILSRHDK